MIPPGQYGAGEVIVWDCGVYSPDEDGIWFHDRVEAQKQIREGLAKGKLSILLRGEKLKGSFALVRTKDAKTWLMIKHRDRFVSGKVDVTLQNRSVLSGATVDDQSRRAGASDARRAARADGRRRRDAEIDRADARRNRRRAVQRRRWMWEPKLDGYRVIAFVDAKGVRLQSRRGIELAAAFPKLVAELAASRSSGMILDGELVAFDANGKPSFNAMQNRVQLKIERDIAAAERKTPVVFFAFDLLYFAGHRSAQARLRDRRRYLAQCLLPSPLVQLVLAQDDGIALNQAALASGFEGVIGKRKDSRYETGKRSKSWLKIKPIAHRGFRDRRLHEGQRLARDARRAAGRLLRRRASCTTPRTSARVSTIGRSRRSKKRLEALKIAKMSVRRKAASSMRR